MNIQLFTMREIANSATGRSKSPAERSTEGSRSTARTKTGHFANHPVHDEHPAVSDWNINPSIHRQHWLL
jgi:hypothetical protein